MKYLSFIILSSLIFFSCGDKKDTSKPLEFKNQKEKLSYILGAINAKTLANSGEASFSQLDKSLLIKGFNENLNGKSTEECLRTLQKLFGATYQDFNKKYIKEGSLCMGKMTGYAFYFDIKKLGGLNDVNLEFVKRGYEDGLFKRDTVNFKEKEMREQMEKFIVGLNEKNGAKMMNKAKKIKGAEIFENGIIMQTLRVGKGTQPGANDDVKVHYILTSALGDTVQNSYTMKNEAGNIEPVPLQLSGGVIPGWSFALPKMKKGGLCRVYIPWDLAYGEQQGRESLCFVIELIDHAKTGTFVKPQINPNIQY
jgi:FKBP-type peptidyl-prolyl cis-trans isomerase